jgi:thiamine transport system substrate-binding protein
MTKKNGFVFFLASLIIIVVAPWSRAADAPRILRMLTHSSFSASKSVIAKFETENNARLEFIAGGDAGEMLNKAILSRSNPLADVIYGVDTTFASRALDAGILDAYHSPLLSRIPASLKIDPADRLLPVDFGYVCLVYDRSFFAQKMLKPPAKLEDLTQPAYKSLVVVENPATSSPGLAFLLATIGYFGETGTYGWQGYWRDLRKNDVLVVDGWNDAYYGEFSAAGKGRRPIVVSYATDPASDIYYAPEPKPAEPRVATILPAGGAFRQVEFVGILKGAREVDLARRWVDFMLSADFQKDIPLQMWVYPSNPDAGLPELFARLAPLPSRAADLDPTLIGKKRDEWIDQWTRIVVR